MNERSLQSTLWCRNDASKALHKCSPFTIDRLVVAIEDPFSCRPPSQPPPPPPPPPPARHSLVDLSSSSLSSTPSSASRRHRPSSGQELLPPGGRLLLTLTFTPGVVLRRLYLFLPDSLSLSAVCDADAVFDILSNAAPLPPGRRHTESVKGSRGFVDYDHLPASQGTSSPPSGRKICCWHIQQDDTSHKPVSNFRVILIVMNIISSRSTRSTQDINHSSIKYIVIIITSSSSSRSSCSSSSRKRPIQ